MMACNLMTLVLSVIGIILCDNIYWRLFFIVGATMTSFILGMLFEHSIPELPDE